MNRTNLVEQKLDGYLGIRRSGRGTFRTCRRVTTSSLRSVQRTDRSGGRQMVPAYPSVGSSTAWSYLFQLLFVKSDLVVIFIVLICKSFEQL